MARIRLDRGPGRLVTLLLAAFPLSGCASYGFNYLDPAGPRCAGSFSRRPLWGAEPPDAPVEVVSFNVHFAKDVRRALGTLRRAGLDKADLILLQEMDDTGSEWMARELGYDWVYYPASVHPASGRPFGLAVLSPWPIRRDRKIPLPPLSSSDDTQKIALAAEVWVRGVRFGVVNVHLQSGLGPVQLGDQVQILTACLFGGPCTREDDPLLAALPYYVVAGDFNTRGSTRLAVVRDLMEKAGLVLVEGTGRSYKYLPGAMGRLDHFFVSPTLEPLAAGHVGGLFGTGSDHRPIRVSLARTGPAPRPWEGFAPLPGGVERTQTEGCSLGSSPARRPRTLSPVPRSSTRIP